MTPERVENAGISDSIMVSANDEPQIKGPDPSQWSAEARAERGAVNSPEGESGA